MPTFGSKKTYQNQALRETKDTKTKTALFPNNAYFWISRCQNDAKNSPNTDNMSDKRCQKLDIPLPS